MTLNNLLFILVAALSLLGIFFILKAILSYIKKRIPLSKKDALDVIGLSEPRRILIGENASHPVITIEDTASISAYNDAKPISINNATANRLSAALQAAPSLLVAAEASGKRIMEVTIDGALTRAADGNGYRAFAMSTNGISEHARLFEVDKLQNMVNAAAVWQIASVVVAQKHLADISEKLDHIKNGIEEVSRFLDTQRKSRLQSAFDYLNQVSTAIGNGELTPAIRIELESCERDLLEIQNHLVHEFNQIRKAPPKHSDTFGTKDLCTNIGDKITSLKEVACDISFCINTRLLASYVLSLFPGESNLKEARLSKVHDDIHKIRELSREFSESTQMEISKVNATWNSKSTLLERKALLASRLEVTLLKLDKQVDEIETNLKRTQARLVQHDLPTHLLFEVNNGKLIGARERV